MSPPILFALLLYPYMMASLFCHEAGHAIAASVIGYRPRSMQVGSGRVLLRIKIGSMWLVIHATPVYGWVIALDAGRSRFHDAVVTAAGPCTNIGLILLGIHVLELSPDYELPLLLAVLIQVTFIVGSLYPNSIDIEGKRFPSDGLRLWRLMTQANHHPHFGNRPELIKPFATEGVPASRLWAHLAEIDYQTHCLMLNDHQWRRDDAAKILRDFSGLEHFTDLEQAFVLSMISLYQLLTTPVALDRDNAEQASARALLLAPDPYTKIIRGGALVEVGCADMAVDLLLPLATMQVAPAYRVLCRAFIGQAKIALGDKRAASMWFEAARSFPEAEADYFPELLTNLWQAASERATIHAVLDVYVLGLPTRPAN